MNYIGIIYDSYNKNFIESMPENTAKNFCRYLFMFVPLLLIIILLTPHESFAQCNGYGAFIAYKKITGSVKDTSVLKHPYSSNKGIPQTRILAEGTKLPLPVDEPYIKEKDFQDNVYTNLTSCTFPLNTDDNLRKFCKVYDPKKSDDEILNEAFKKTQYGAIFLPRSVYELLYYIFWEVQGKKNIVIGLFDIYLNFRINPGTAKMLEYWNAYIQKEFKNQVIIEEYAQFNNWALQYMIENKFIDLSSLIDNSPKSLSPDIVIAIIKNILPKQFSDSILIQALKYECDPSFRKFFLLYRGIKDGKKGTNWMIWKEKEIKNTCTPNSVSYNSGLFGGAANDLSACTIAYLSTRAGYMVIIPREDYLEKIHIGSHFFVPPLPIITAIHANGEYWHARTKVMVPKIDGKECKDSDLSVQGIGGMYELPNINRIPWLQMNFGEEWPFDKIIKTETDHEQFLDKSGIDFTK